MALDVDALKDLIVATLKRADADNMKSEDYSLKQDLQSDFIESVAEAVAQAVIVHIQSAAEVILPPHRPQNITVQGAGGPGPHTHTNTQPVDHDRGYIR